ncbi:DgyrCDS2154 [Dimorphilus gyrociliatus]|uniref:DgyrCDS2154 n=1 Tax=Dimorphilus gyrociliatus TaxID=2664684 RepID=A0A7I8V9E5_9ANNE|nr:DgyrCDS2154 [Dimorphilus gyrociliatus]
MPGKRKRRKVKRKPSATMPVIGSRLPFRPMSLFQRNGSIRKKTTLDQRKHDLQSALLNGGRVFKPSFLQSNDNIVNQFDLDEMRQWMESNKSIAKMKRNAGPIPVSTPVVPGVPPESGYTTREGSVSSHVAQSLGSEFDTLTLSSQGSFREENTLNYTYSTAECDFEPIPEPPKSSEPTEFFSIVPPPPPPQSVPAVPPPRKNGIQGKVDQPKASDPVDSSQSHKTTEKSTNGRYPPPPESTISDSSRYQTISIGDGSDIYETIDESKMANIYNLNTNGSMPTGEMFIETVPAPPSINEVLHVPIVPPPPPSNDLEIESRSKGHVDYSEPFRAIPSPSSTDLIPSGVPPPPESGDKISSPQLAPRGAPAIPDPPIAPAPPPPPQGVAPDPPFTSETPSLHELPPPPPVHTSNLKLQIGSSSKPPTMQRQTEPVVSKAVAPLKIPTPPPIRDNFNSSSHTINEENLPTVPPPPPIEKFAQLRKTDDQLLQATNSSPSVNPKTELLQAINRFQEDKTVSRAPKQIVLNRETSESETVPKRPAPPPTMPRLNATLSSTVQSNQSSGIEVPRKRSVTDIVKSLGNERKSEDLPPPPPPLAPLDSFEYASLDNIPPPPPVGGVSDKAIPIAPPPPPLSLTLPTDSSKRGPPTKPKMAPPTANKPQKTQPAVEHAELLNQIHQGLSLKPTKFGSKIRTEEHQNGQDTPIFSPEEIAQPVPKSSPPPTSTKPKKAINFSHCQPRPICLYERREKNAVLKLVNSQFEEGEEDTESTVEEESYHWQTEDDLIDYSSTTTPTLSPTPTTTTMPSYSDEFVFDPTTCPNYQPIPDNCPEWKRSMLEDKNKKLYEDAKARWETARAEEERWRDVPAWKKNLIKHQEQRKKVENAPAEVERQKHEAEMERLNKLPDWKKNLILKKRGEID